MFGTAGIRYSLIGNGADKFEIRDPTRAVISVRRCTGVPGKGPLCLDRELAPSYTLFLVATDNQGTGNSNSTSIVFTVLDENDNPPIFDSATGTYEFFINEGQTSGSPIFQVSATDADSPLNGNNVVQYSIVGENATTYDGLWRILSGGIIVASRPVDYETIPGLTGSYVFYAQAQDSSSPYFKAYDKIVINVIDLNDNAPIFTVPSPVSLSVLETMNGSHYLTTLKATDGDLPTTANGRVSYSIQSGAQGKFTINDTTGDLYTTAAATFDYDVQPVYVLNVVAEDNGSPRLQAVLKVNVHVIDTNNRFPYFLMNPKLVQVYENTPVGSFVTQMTAMDQDSASQLNFTVLSTVYKRLDGTVTTSNATLFNLSPTSANVTVLNKLNRDIVSEVTMLVHVADLNATSPQTATATLIIAILDVNDRAPEFVRPWTLSNPYYNMSIDEEQPIGSFVVVLTATDPDGPLSGYYIVNDPLSAFSISSSGTVTLRGRLDFEAVEATNFTVVAVDSGVPRLSATATVSITLNNINDMSPIVQQSQYQFSLVETYGPAPSTPLSGPNRFLGVVNASDADKGDYGSVTFQLADPRFFLVPSANGAEVYANGTAYFDREVTNQIVLQLQVSDSPANPTVRRFVSAPVYVQILDVNDNAPRFLVPDYYATVGNNAPIGTLFVSVLATDIDINNTLTYSLQPSANSDLFAMNSSSGQLTSTQSLTTKAGNMLLTGVVSDGVHNATCSIHITILESSRTPPVWVSPSSDNNTLQVLEEQYLGLIITRLQARADNSSSAEVARLTYGILYGDAFVDETPQFKVNPVTGVLTANIIFDRERQDQYLLNLAVRDGRTPPLESRLFVMVQILDVDDNKPVFDRSNYAFSVAESVSVNTSVGTVRATDLDIGVNAIIRYSIVLGNTGNAFRIDAVTGEIFVNSPLDRETTADYSLQVGSGSAGSSSVASVVTVNISIGDVNDNVPAFSQPIFSASLPYDSQFGSLIVRVSAADPDYGDNALVAFSVADDRGLMSIDSAGRVTLVSLPTSSSTTPATARLSAWNPVRASAISSATLRVWFTSSAEVAVLTVTQTPDWVSQHLDMYRTQLVAITNTSNVFITSVRYHLSKDGEPDLTRTDLLVTASRPDLTLYSGPELSKLVLSAMSSGDSAANLRFLKLQDASGASDPGAAGDVDLSLPAIAACVVLAVVLLAALGFAIAMYCMQKSLAARCAAQAGANHLQFLNIQGMQKHNMAYDESTIVG
ncbi:hypothetical protein BOX15_Mlig010092g4 [Macrostomum lignano]|uniref:Cadherin domain-containing protein n=1 Tax=Macrostomum lignano TaxID=282301 RepID=A0A267H0N9_9PLAT|nr:hypothetical protein BOX15_Mlig010092g4 [Macrostomum lignano]